MNYQFPEGMTLSEVRDIVSRHNERIGAVSFIEADRGDHVIFNYIVAFADTFPAMTGDPSLDREYAILRECRGLTFSKATGRVIARKFHKFFNVNERDETQDHAIDWSQPHVIFEKLDGSMICPFRPDGSDTIRWGTKMGITDVAAPVEEFVSRNPEYNDLAIEAEGLGFTPIFEWCSRQQKIVIDYPEDRLVLTAVREIETGLYLPSLTDIGEKYGIPVAKTLGSKVDDVARFLESTRVLKGEEGYVVRFNTGHMVKAKAEEYCRFHKAKDGLTFEKDVVALILSDEFDDAKAFMDDDDRRAVDAFAEAMMAGINAYAADLASEVEFAMYRVRLDAKRFALEHVANIEDGFRKGLSFQAFQGADMPQAIRRLIGKHVFSSSRVESVRHLFGDIHWRDFRNSTFGAAE